MRGRLCLQNQFSLPPWHFLKLLPMHQKGSCSKLIHQLELTPVEQQHYEVLLKNMEEYCTQYTQLEATFKNRK